MTEHQTDLEVAGIRDSKGLEAIFRTLWEKVKRAGELIQHLKEENSALLSKNSSLEDELSRTKSELVEKEETLRRLRQEQLEMLSRGNSLFSDEEKEALRVKIKDLLSRINSHL